MQDENNTRPLWSTSK